MKRWLVVALGGLAQGCQTKPESLGAAPAPSASARASSHVHIDPSMIESGRVRLGTAVRRRLEDLRVFPGEVISDESGHAEVGALVSGRIASLEVGVGAAVKKGQILAWLDAPEVARVASDVIRARARVEVAERKERRQLELEKQEATSKNAVDEARAEVRVARADQAAAESLLRSLGGGLRKTSSPDEAPPLTSRIPLRSPIDGIVARRAAVLGGSVSPDKLLFEIVARGHAVVLVRAPELVALPPPGTAALVRSRGAEGATEGCPGTTQGDLGVVDPETRTRTLRILPSQPCAWLTPGGFVSVELQPATPGTQPEKNVSVLSVVREAVVDIRGTPVVFVLDAKTGDFLPKPVRVRMDRGVFAIIEDGLGEGDRIVEGGAMLLKGELVRAEMSSE